MKEPAAGIRLTVEKANSDSGAGFKLATHGKSSPPAFKAVPRGSNTFKITKNRVLRWSAAKKRLWGLKLLRDLLQQGLDALLVPADFELSEQQQGKGKEKRQQQQLPAGLTEEVVAARRSVLSAAVAHVESLMQLHPEAVTVTQPPAAAVAKQRGSARAAAAAAARAESAAEDASGSSDEDGV
jgi:hypothetical protein